MSLQTKLIAFAACNLMAANAAHAGGFFLTNHGARSTGRANATAATNTDGSAIFHNVAGIGFSEGTTNLYIGGALIIPDSSFTPESSGESFEAKTSPSLVPSVYAYGAVGEVLRWGIGFYAPFGSSLGWEQGAPGNDTTTDQTLETLFITPAVALNLSRWVPGLSIGGGVDFVPAAVELKQDVIFGTDEGTAHLGGNGFGLGGRLGLMYKPPAVKGLSIGATWRSAVTLDMSGDADFDAPPPYRSQLPPDGRLSADIKLPQSIQGGVAYRPIDSLEIELDVFYVGWSRFDTIDIELESGVTLVSDRGYEDIVGVSIGLEYAVPDLNLDARVGYIYDPTPIPDGKLTVALPDIDRHVLTVGGSYKLPKNTFADLGIMWILPGDNTTGTEPFEPQLKGTFDVQALVVSLSFGATFGADDNDATQPMVASTE